MFILSGDGERRLLSEESILLEYGKPSKHSNGTVKKGELCINRDTLVWKECRLCGDISQVQYQNYRKKPDRACLSCVKIGSSNPQFGKKGYWFGKSTPVASIAKMVETRKRDGSYSHSEETKAKIRERNLGSGNPNYGKRWTKEMREKASKRVVGWYLSGKYPSKANTLPEIKMARIFNRNNIPNEQQHAVDGKIFDFLLPSINTLVEIDGVYWHGKGIPYDKKNATQKHNDANDKIKNLIAVNNGFRIIRVWGDEIRDGAAMILNDIRSCRNESHCY